MCDGSYVTWTASACPVRPVLTFSYCAVSAAPPEYPEVARITPFRRSNTAWMPQKQPPARTAVCCPFAGAKGASTDGLGIATDAPPVLHAAPFPRGSTAARIAKARKMNRSTSILLGGRTDTLVCPVRFRSNIRDRQECRSY